MTNRRIDHRREEVLLEKLFFCLAFFVVVFSTSSLYILISIEKKI